MLLQSQATIFWMVDSEFENDGFMSFSNLSLKFLISPHRFLSFFDIVSRIIQAGFFLPT